MAAQAGLPDNPRLPLLRSAAFLAGLLVLLHLLNVEGGAKRIRQDIWFSRIAGQGMGHTADALFIGSSRVSAAVRSEVFDKALSELLRHPIQSANLGMGGSTMTEWVLGLRRLQELNPDAIRGSVVFIEAPVGVPEYRTWKDSWLVESAPELLTRYLEPDDLGGFLRSATPVHQKIVVLAELELGIEENLSRLRSRARAGFDEQTLPATEGIIGEPPWLPPQDLSTTGGIQSDPRGLLRSRITALANVRSELARQVPRRDWDSTTLRGLVDRIRGMGALPVFFEMPLSREMASMYATPVRAEDRVAFQRAVAEWRIPYIQPAIATTDADFPDIWHLRKSRAAEYTAQLTREFVERIVMPALRAAPQAPAADTSARR